MKFFIALMFFTVVSGGRPARKRDVSEYYGAGWSKSDDGYNYNIPTSNLDNTLTYYDEPVYSVSTYEPTYVVPSSGLSYDVVTGGIGTFGSVEYYPQETYVQGLSNDYLLPFRRRKHRLQKRKLRVAKRQ